MERCPSDSRDPARSTASDGKDLCVLLGFEPQVVTGWFIATVGHGACFVSQDLAVIGDPAVHNQFSRW